MWFGKGYEGSRFFVYPFRPKPGMVELVIKVVGKQLGMSLVRAGYQPVIT